MPALGCNFDMTTYFEELKKSMEYLAGDPRVIFMGQAVAVAGTAMRNSLINIEEQKLIELPVEEDFQMGLAIGMSLNGFIPVSIFPRWNFLLLATNQIINHLDKLKEMTQMSIPPKTIIRTGIGSISPLHPGPQHTGDFTEAFSMMCTNLNVVRLDQKNDIFPAYEEALNRTDGVSTLLIEWSDKYND